MSTPFEAEEDELIASLPVPAPAAPGSKRLHLGTTAVEMYVRDVAERPPPFVASSDFLDVLHEALFRQNLKPPVSAVDVARTLDKILLPARVADLCGRAHELPSLMKELNGDAFRLVPPAIVAEAAHREKVIGGLKHGWGPVVPCRDTASYYLLVSSGMPPALLPPYVPLPAAGRKAFLQNWTGICAQFGWQASVPDVETRAAKSAIVKELRAADGAK